MPAKNVVTLSELVLISLVWNACQTVWRSVTIDGIAQAVSIVAPQLDRSYQNLIVGSVLMATLYATILLARNVNIGRIKVFELEG